MMHDRSASFRRLTDRFSGWSTRRQDRPVRKPWRRLANRVVSILGLAYLTLLAFPGFLFAHRVAHGAFQVYSDRPIGPELASVLERASARLDRSPLADHAMTHRIYICNGRALRTLLSPATSKAFGSTYPWLLRRNTILNRVDVRANLASSDAPRNNRRPLDSVIAHERTHALIARRLGDLWGWTVPDWKSEGYCEYVAGGPSFDVEEGKRLVAERRGDESSSFQYFRYGLMVRFLLDVQKVGVDELFDRSFDPEQVMEQVRANLDKL